jgi:hypothetical protein
LARAQMAFSTSCLYSLILAAEGSRITSVFMSYCILILDPSYISSVQPRQVKTILGKPSVLSKEDWFYIRKVLPVAIFELDVSRYTESSRFLSSDS